MAALFSSVGLRRMDAEVIVERACAPGAAGPAGAAVARSQGALGKDDSAANARSSGGLDADGGGKAEDGSKASSSAVPADQAAGDLLASLPQECADGARANRQTAPGMGNRARRGAAAHGVVCAAGLESGLARPSGLREADRRRRGACLATGTWTTISDNSESDTRSAADFPPCLPAGVPRARFPSLHTKPKER